jgi:hypothetical protein
MASTTIEQRFRSALGELVEQVREDRSILAAILCGSLSYDRVWEKSDIDLVLITIDDRKAEDRGVALWADGLNVHAFLMPRAAFRRLVEGALQHSFMHSFLARGELLYTHDESIAHLFSRLAAIGERDTQVQLLNAANNALAPFYKARKWLITRDDPDYAALWILFTAVSLARVEVISRGVLADREVIPQALRLAPDFFRTIYVDMLNAPKTRERVQAALDAIDAWLAERATRVFAPVLDYLREVGEARSCTEIENHFERNMGVGGVTSACEYLADRGLIGKASIPIQLTKRSNIEMQELAFFHLART